jgi:hypothetical protein
MDPAEEVVAAAEERADALVRSDAARLLRLLHPQFRWTSHTGQQFDRDGYVKANTGTGRRRWSRQTLVDPEVIVVADVAVLRCTVVDEVDSGWGTETYRMPMTQVWVRDNPGWTCLAGHAGPHESADAV